MGLTSTDLLEIGPQKLGCKQVRLAGLIVLKMGRAPCGLNCWIGPLKNQSGFAVVGPRAKEMDVGLTDWAEDTRAKEAAACGVELGKTTRKRWTAASVASSFAGRGTSSDAESISLPSTLLRLTGIWQRRREQLLAEDGRHAD